MWDRWQKGDSLHDIGRLFDRYYSSVSRIIGVTGGIRPPLRRRAACALTLSEREVIFRGLSQEHSVRTIAGSSGGDIATLVELKTCYVVFAKVDNKTIEAVVQVLVRQLKKGPANFIKH